MNLPVSIEQFSPEQLQLLQAQIFQRQQILLQKEVEHLKDETKRLKTQLEIERQEREHLKHRVDNVDLTNIEGDLQQRFNKMVRLYATKNGITFQKGYREFKGYFNIAYRANITALHENYQLKYGAKLTLPQYLMVTGQIEDAIRVLDKMLNNQQIS